MGGGLSYRQHQNGRTIEGAKYRYDMLVKDVSRESPLPEDGKQYIVFTAKYLHYAVGQRVTCLFSRQEEEERKDYDFVFATDVFSDMPWRMPEAVLDRTTLWVHLCSFDALARGVLSGGEEHLEGDLDDQTYELATQTKLRCADLECVDQDQACAGTKLGIQVICKKR